MAHRLVQPVPQALDRAQVRLSALSRALASLDPKRPKPGFARIDDAHGRMITRAADLVEGQTVSLIFPDGSKGARIDGGEGSVAIAEPPSRPSTPPRPATPKPKPIPPGQGDLF